MLINIFYLIRVDVSVLLSLLKSNAFFKDPDEKVHCVGKLS